MKSTTKRILVLIVFGLVFTFSTIRNPNYPPKTSENIISYSEQDAIDDEKSPGLSAVRDLAEEWIQTWGRPGLEKIYDLAMDTSENIYIAGVIDSDELFLLKYDKNGVLKWNETFGTGSYLPTTGVSLTIDSQVNIFIAAVPSPYDRVELYKYNSSGDLQWSQVFVTDDTILIYDMASDSSDNILLAGAKDSDILVLLFNTAGVYQWNTTWDGNRYEYAKAITLDSSDNIYIAGYDYELADNPRDGILVKFNDIGVFQWNRTYGLVGGDNWEIFTDIKLDSSGNIYIVGEVFARSRGFLVKYNDLGDYQWNLTLTRQIKKLVIDSSDDIFILGPPLLLKSNSTGEEQWNCSLFDKGAGYGMRGIGIDSSDNLYVAEMFLANVYLVKFSSKPKITIHSPDPNEVCGASAPDYNISIYEPDINTRWYTLDNGTTNTTFTELIETIDQDVWKNVDEGERTLTFYANDTFGNLGSSEVSIIKWIPDAPPPGGGGGGGGGDDDKEGEAIPGYNLYLAIGLIGIITIILIEKRKKSLN